MRYFKIVLDTRGLTVKQEDELLDALENVYRVDFWDENWREYGAEYLKITPECVCEYGDDGEEVYGQIVIEGEATDYVIEDLYDVFKGVVPYTDNDPFNLKFDNFLMTLMKDYASNSVEGERIREQSRKIAAGV